MRKASSLGAPVLCLGLILAPFAAGMASADTPPQRRPLTSDDLYNTQLLSDPQVAPDGDWVAYVVSTHDRESDEGRSAIWMVSWDGAQQVQLTNPAHEISSPRWSRDGRYLAYLSVPAGTDKSQILLLDRRGGEARTLTTVTGDIESFEWAPDSQHLVVVMEQGPPKTKPGADVGKDAPAQEPARNPGEKPEPIVIDSMHFKEDKDGYLGSGHNRHLYLLDVAGKKLEQLTGDPAFNEDLPAWSGDGRHIAFVRTREKGPDPDGMQEIGVIEPRPGSSAAQLLRINAPNQQKLAWSADGKRLVFLQGVEAKYAQYGQDRLAIVNTSSASGAPEVLTDSLDRAVSAYGLNKESDSITVLTEDDTIAYPVLVNTRTRQVRKFPQGLSVVSGLSVAKGHTAVLASNDTSPSEVYAFEQGHLRKLTRHNDAFVAGLQLGAVEDLRFNSADGTQIHGLLVKPPGYEPGKRYPTILWIHGGPNLQDSHSFAFDDYQFKRQMLAAAGFVVVGVNYRGSSGRGDAFARAIYADWGHKEVADLLAAMDQVVQQGIADPNRLGIGGWSYGGMLTDYTIASDTRFKAAVSGAGTANPLGMYAADQYYIQYNKELGDPWRNTDLYIKLAYPLLHADRIRTPTLFMGGDKDFNVPIVGGEQMYLALRTLEVPAQLIVYPGEYHTFTRPSYLKDRADRVTAWFNRYLLSSAQTVRAAPGNR